MSLIGETIPIFNYVAGDYEDVDYRSDDTCEDVCTEFCKKVDIRPAARLLFGMRYADTRNWLPPSQKLSPSRKYEFRVRFKMPVLSNLKQLDKSAYDYYFFQVRHDCLNSNIPEIEYNKHKDKLLGLGVADMYREIIEKHYVVEDLMRNYKQYIPKELSKKHSIFAKRSIWSALMRIKKKGHDAYYVKESYLQQVNTIAPNYLTEVYQAAVPYLKEDELENGTCPVTVQFNPFHPDEPGLRVYHFSKNLWIHITKIEDIYAIIMEKDTIKVEMRDQPAGYKLFISDKEERDSFVSCLAGYYRLACKWTVDLCRDLLTPSLQNLRSLKCHGPIGGEFAYTKIEEKNNIPGSYIIRQCGQNYDTYFIDIITKNHQPETFKITHKSSRWHLHGPESIKAYDKLTELAKSIKTESKEKFRLAPSEYDKPSQLLLCIPPHQLTVKKTFSELAEMRQIQPQCIDAVKDLQLYINTQKDCEGGVLTQIRGDWKLPGDKKLEVTLKILKPNMGEKHLSEFMHLAYKWSRLDSTEIVKLYGITLFQPIGMVLESTKLGPLDEFLRKNKNVSMVCLIDASYSLARALHYLQENNIIHGKIRCSTLQVVKYESPNMLIVRLGDPGFQRKFTTNDVPWIPVDYHYNLELAKVDLKAEIWAYATTLWEIFSRGRRIENIQEHFAPRRCLDKPKDCPYEINEIIFEGWDPDPDKRFSPQIIFSRLFSARELYSHAYSSIDRPRIDDTSTIGSKQSVLTVDTELSSIGSNSENSYGSSNGSELTISDGSYGRDSMPLLFDGSKTKSCPTILTNGLDFGRPGAGAGSASQEGYLEQIPSVVETENYKVIFQGRIGHGHYGIVYRGTIEDADDQVREVAIKTLTAVPDQSVMIDFHREIRIMKKLNHPNIVKIIDHLDEPQISIIMEYIKHRSFLMYLSSQSPSLTSQRLLKFAKDIASGMEYLRSQKIVHRDLAARNVLVDSDECVKISDFGLAQVADANGYYIVRNNRDIPIKWYAPETLRSNKYSYQSDVWSYGVTLFEMFSRGQEPNLCPGRELTQLELLEHFERGERLPIPPLCPNNIYESLMSACWRERPQNRPNFTEILVAINNLIAEYGESV